MEPQQGRREPILKTGRSSPVSRGPDNIADRHLDLLLAAEEEPERNLLTAPGAVDCGRAPSVIDEHVADFGSMALA
jgi:hypothetical protein